MGRRTGAGVAGLAGAMGGPVIYCQQRGTLPIHEVEIKKDKKIKKNNSTININFINIQQNIIQNTSKNQKVINYKNTSRRKEIKTDISSPLLNYIKTQKSIQK